MQFAALHWGNQTGFDSLLHIEEMQVSLLGVLLFCLGRQGSKETTPAPAAKPFDCLVP